MSVFKDSEGREWHLEIAFGHAIKIKKQTGFNLQDVLKDFTAVATVADDPERFFSIICILLEEQLEKKKLSEEDLAEAINDFGVVEEMQRAFVEAVIDFFPKDRKAILSKAFRSFLSAIEKKAEAEVGRLDQVNFDDMAEKFLSTSFKSDAGSPAMSEASTTGSSPSENSSR